MPSCENILRTLGALISEAEWLRLQNPSPPPSFLTPSDLLACSGHFCQNLPQLPEIRGANTQVPFFNVFCCCFLPAPIVGGSSLRQEFLEFAHKFLQDILNLVRWPFT